MEGKDHATVKEGGKGRSFGEGKKKPRFTERVQEE